MFLCGVLILFFWQSTIYPVRGQTGGEPINGSTAKVEKMQIVIQKGDTLWSLAQKYQLSLEQLTQINHIAYPDHIRAGQKLWIVTPDLSQEHVQQEIQTLIQPQVSIRARSQIQTQAQAQAVQVQNMEKVKTVEIIMGQGEEQEIVVQTEAQETRVSQPSVAQETAPVASRGQQVQATVKDQATKADLDLLARVIYAEARGEDFEGQVAVGAVVLNRLKDSSFPKTIRDVVYQTGAFTAVSDKQIHLTPDEEAYRAAETALTGQDPTGGALYYFNPKTATDRWIKSRSVIKQIGNHTFSI